METMHNIDFYVFEWINNGLSNLFFDWILPPFRNRNTWIPLYVLLLIYLVYKYKLKAFLIVAFAVLSIVLADGVSSHILKPYVARIRPCNLVDISQILILRVDHCSGGFSFPSSHAANHFALASFLGLTLIVNSKWFLRIGLTWAAIISFAQIYVGVHFPIDVLFGSFLGLLIGVLLNKAYLDINHRYFKN